VRQQWLIHAANEVISLFLKLKMSCDLADLPADFNSSSDNEDDRPATKTMHEAAANSTYRPAHLESTSVASPSRKSSQSNAKEDLLIDDYGFVYKRGTAAEHMAGCVSCFLLLIIIIIIIIIMAAWKTDSDSAMSLT
jgi:hypothetical protein